MNNPLSERPEHALFPYPQGSTGWRIWQMLKSRLPDVSRVDYLRGFDRVNLINSREWDAAEAWAAAEHLPSLYRGRTIVVFGEAVRKALELPKELVHPVQRRGCTWRMLPHPSGRCRWYNDPAQTALAAALLEELYLRGKK